MSAYRGVDRRVADHVAVLPQAVVGLAEGNAWDAAGDESCDFQSDLCCILPPIIGKERERIATYQYQPARSIQRSCSSRA